jgi:hypothetical protein
MKYSVIIFLSLLGLHAFGRPAAEKTETDLKSYYPLTECYEKFLADTPMVGKSSGAVTVDLKLNKLGEVIGGSVDKERSRLYSPKFNSCLIAELKKLKFSEESSGKEEAISVALSFPLRATK